MATTQHPTHMGVRFRGNHEWLWIGLSAILVGMIAAAIVWAVSRPETATSTALPEAVSGFEYNHEATAGRTVSPGVTGEYFGNSGELFAETVAEASVYSVPRFNPIAAADAGLNPGLIDVAVGGTVTVDTIDLADLKFLQNVVSEESGRAPLQNNQLR